MSWETDMGVLLDIIAQSFQRQTNVKIKGSDLEFEFQKPAIGNDIAVFIRTKRLNDYLRIRLYVKFENTISIGKFRLYEDKNYAAGPNDEVWVGTGSIDRRLMKDLVNYIRGLDLNALNPDIFFISEEDEKLLSEDGRYLVMG